jgi:Fic-DOC domain mobile mystery protein B
MIGWKARAGETPITDFSCLKPKGLTLWKEVSDLEAENIRKPLLKYLAAKPSVSLAPFDFTWVLRLHEEMFCDVWTWAGRIRKENLNIGVDFTKVETCLFELIKDLKYWEQSGVEIHEQAVMFHHKAVLIHPFSGGNGRWARMLENVWLTQHDTVHTNWPEETIEAESPIRGEYIAALKKADDGDYTPLMELHARHNADSKKSGISN